MTCVTNATPVATRTPLLVTAAQTPDEDLQDRVGIVCWRHNGGKSDVSAIRQNGVNSN